MSQGRAGGPDSQRETPLTVGELVELLETVPQNSRVRLATELEDLEVFSVYSADTEDVVWIDIGPGY